MTRAWPVLLVIVLASCGGNKDPNLSAPAAAEAARSAEDPSAWVLSPDEQRWVEDRKAAGGLNVASTETEGAYRESPEGPVGFHAALARGFGEFLGLPVHFQTVAFNTYFSRNGEVPNEVKTDPSVSYEPDVFRTADLAAFNFSDLPWRRKLMDFHKVFPTRVVLVAPRGREIRQLSELTNRRIVVFSNSSQEQYMKQLKQNLALNFSLVSVPFETNLFEYIRAGKADAMLREANAILPTLQSSPDFNVTLPLMDTEWSHWAVSKQSSLLGGLVEKYLNKARATGELSRVWFRSYGLSLEAYETSIGDAPPPSWTDEDREVLGRLTKTGLRVAIDKEQTIYEPQADGSARGVSYNLLLEVAKRLQVPLKATTVSFGEYFAEGGRFPEQVRTDPSFHYRPDLLNRVDLYVDTLSPLPWRKKFLAFVSLYPSQLVWVVRKNGGSKPGPGKKVAVLAESSYQDWLTSAKVTRPEDLILTRSGDEAVRMVIEGKADLTVSDANLALGWLSKYPSVTFFPANQEVQDLSWAVAKDDVALRSLLEKTLNSLRDNGTFSTVWQNYYGVSLSEYLGLLAKETAP